MQLDVLVQQVADGTTDEEIYRAANRLIGALSDQLISSVTASALYLIWQCLTDRYELTDERSEACAVMASAAQEWLALNALADRRRYLDHWQYEVCGCERPSWLRARFRQRSHRRGLDLSQTLSADG